MQKLTESELDRDSGHEIHRDKSRLITRKSAIVLGILLAGFLLIECLLPLSTTIQIGADEGFELAKAQLWIKGYRLYTDFWNDQPPLHTFLLVETFKHISTSILAARLITVGFSVLLLTSVFILILRISGLVAAAITTGLLIVSPGFVSLSSSCMLEIPALATAMAALCLLVITRQSKWHVWEIIAGILLGISFQIKLVNVFLLPLVALVIWLQHRRTPTPFKSTFRALVSFGASLSVSYVAIDYVIEGGAYLRNFQEAWTSHFGTQKSFEYGSPNDYPFDWSILLKNWDTTIPAVFGILFCFRQIRKEPTRMLLPALFALTLLVFSVHKPWWPYYYIHIAIPLCWCASLGLESIRQRLGQSRVLPVIFALYALCALFWAGARVYQQARKIRSSPQTYSSLVLDEIKRYKPLTEWMYADNEIYSFYAGIPMPPALAVVPSKRLWAGEMNNQRVGEEMRRYKPSVILLANDTRVLPFKDLMDTEYQLVYQDADLQLYALKTITNKVEF
jgi:4-amino-4-deoxy-L-arabinose transferase-like glycosyltransferase